MYAEKEFDKRELRKIICERVIQEAERIAQDRGYDMEKAREKVV
jgi:hypothetical protein